MDKDGRGPCSCGCDLVNGGGLSVAEAEVEVKPAPLVSPYALSLEIKGPLVAQRHQLSLCYFLPDRRRA